MTTDFRIRIAAMKWLDEQIKLYGEILPRSLLEKGFYFEGDFIPLISPQGIFKPKNMRLPLTITSTPNSPYKDTFSPEGLLLYKYRGTDPQHRDNAGLRECMKQKIFLIYLHGISPSQYETVYPVLIVGDNPAYLTFTVEADEFEAVIENYKAQNSNIPVSDSGADIRRRYITTAVRQRLHQHSFRERVLAAYRDQCAFCRLKHRELLDAAHIVEDKDPLGEPMVSNGLSLCKIHHAAFDEHIVGLSPDYIIEVRKDVRDEEDGPMLVYGLQSLHTQKLILPSHKINWPDRSLLARKYERFREVI